MPATLSTKHSARSTSSLILASASPRRAELLTRAHIPFSVVVSPAPEPSRKPPVIPTDLWPTCLACMKATAVHTQLKKQNSKFKNQIILAADTIVVHDNRILNKAPTRAAARRMLLALSGKDHHVITGICLLSPTHVRLSRAVATCRFQKLSEATLAAYLDSNLWQGKAGAYGIQDPFPTPFITLVDGDITTVMGLPMPLLLTELASFPAAQ